MFDDRYTFGTRVDAPIEEVREAVTAALKTEGFGVLTEIDMAATMRAKLGVERAPYVILGACNPPLAHRALLTTRRSAPCCRATSSIRADGDTVVLEVMDPKAVLGLVGDPAMDEVAAEVRARLVRAVEAVQAQFPVTESAQ